ncbi:MAG TPA: cyclopropane-fatty-acyl-phospholipid synthase family protein [Gemmatimonadales bacterium]|jgi:cyclopropane-fatty-acyl-phospholipid synthase|nr:cyclopropane-fatty-acyl-phospholipid synthase family protein [Gemmatimonadales bacterium]
MSHPSTVRFSQDLARFVPDRPFELRFWDGTAVPATRAPATTLTIHSPRALAYALHAPSQLGLGRAYVAGAIDAEDLDALVTVADTWQPPALPLRARARLLLDAARAAGTLSPPRVPASELKPSGPLHSRRRDAQAVRHHYDVSNDFFALFLDRSMTYSCAFFSRSDDHGSLEGAQMAKLELTCQKLALEPGQRVLDVGCGWGGFAIHAASRHGVSVVGITLSEPQAELARQRVRAAGLEDRVTVRVQDYRELDGEQFDAICSIGMVEHVGGERIDLYARQLAHLLRPGGRLLNHGIARLYEAPTGAFNRRYVFPDSDPLPLSRVLLALERAGFVTEHVEGFRRDYAETLRHWARRLDERLDEAVRMAGSERVRVWRLYLRAARRSFESGYLSIYQVRCRLAD